MPWSLWLNDAELSGSTFERATCGFRLNSTPVMQTYLCEFAGLLTNMCIVGGLSCRTAVFSGFQLSAHQCPSKWAGLGEGGEHHVSVGLDGSVETFKLAHADSRFSVQKKRRQGRDLEATTTPGSRGPCSCSSAGGHMHETQTANHWIGRPT